MRDGEERRVTKEEVRDLFKARATAISLGAYVLARFGEITRDASGHATPEQALAATYLSGVYDMACVVIDTAGGSDGTAHVDRVMRKAAAIEAGDFDSIGGPDAGKEAE